MSLLSIDIVFDNDGFGDLVVCAVRLFNKWLIKRKVVLLRKSNQAKYEKRG